MMSSICTAEDIRRSLRLEKLSASKVVITASAMSVMRWYFEPGRDPSANSEATAVHYECG